MDIKSFLVVTGLGLSAYASAQTSQHSIAINGNAADETAKTVYLQKFNNKMFDIIDSASVVDGKFHFQKTLDLPELYGLSTDKRHTPYYLFLDGNDVNVNLVFNRRLGYSESETTGSALQDEFTAYKKLGDEDLDIATYIKQHPASLVSAYILYRDFSYRLSSDEIRSNIALLDRKFDNTPYVKTLVELANTLDNVGVGKKAPDFQVPDTAGVQHSLYEFLGKGYLLVDFWASWCGPCRKENPNVVEAYKKFHDKGFDVLGVSLDRSKERWLKAIHDDGLVWNHVSDLQYWNAAPAKLYGVRAIPSNILLDKDGTVIARNLREEDLHTFLEKLLK